jgi:polyferredoxin
MKEYQGVLQIPETWWFLTGNLFYFGSGIVLAWFLRDNRAFCKYLCPVVAFMKPTSSVSIVRIGAKNDKCTHCRRCAQNCPMDIEVMRYVNEGKRVLSTECILCLTCTSVCPKEVLGVTMGLDLPGVEYLRARPSGPA